MQLIYHNQLVELTRVRDVIPSYGKEYYFGVGLAIYKDSPVTESDDVVLVTPKISDKNPIGTLLQVKLQKLGK